MHSNINITAIPRCVALCTVLLLAGCGNKGDLFIDTREEILTKIISIDDALDELELMEAEEEALKK